MTANFDTARRWLAVLIGFSIPISVALTNILCPLALLLILAEGQYKQKFNTLRRHPIVAAAVLLIAVMVLGFFYTPVSFSEAGRILDKYREFLYILLFILIFRDNTTRQWGLYAFLSAMGVTLFLSYLMAITGWQIGKGTPENPFIFKNYITQGLLMALAAYFVALQAWHQSRWRWLRGIVVVLAIYNIVFLSEGRTGYLVLFCLIFLFSYQTYRVRGVIVGSLLLAIIGVLVYEYSDALRQRVDNVSEGVQDYQQGEIKSSIGMRIEFNKNSLVLFAEKPFFGYGTGSFSNEYKKLAEIQRIRPTTNPHNEYLMIGVQWGLLGVGIFVFLLYVMWRATGYLDTQTAMMAEGLVLTIAVGCLVNSLWLDSTEGHLFAYLIGIFYGKFPLKPFSKNTTLNPVSKNTALNPVSRDLPDTPLERGQGRVWRSYFSVVFNKLLEMKKIYQKAFFAVIIVMMLAFISYRSYLILRTDGPHRINQEVALVMKVVAAMMNTSIIAGREANAPTAIAIDSKGSISAVETQFQSVAKTSSGLSGNHLTVPISDKITVSTRIKVDPRHVGKKARFVIMASYQAADGTPAVFFQRTGDAWGKLEIGKLKAAQLYPQLPDSVEVPIYDGNSLGVAGKISIFVAYVLDSNYLVLSVDPVRLVFVE
jgi:O-antigen ligase